MESTSLIISTDSGKSKDHQASGNGKISEQRMTEGVGELFTDFHPISLEDTNNRAQMLTRFDNKYILSRKQLDEFLTLAKTCYSALEIGGTRVFRYESCYYDQNYLSYYHHHNGNRLRFKVRTRHYINAGIKYFEVKLKDHRGRTKKDRIKVDWFMMDRIDGPCLSMLEEFYKSTYGREFDFDLKPALIVSNQRVTLVSQVSAERMTIDFSVGFKKPGGEGEQVRVGEDFIIVETKSGNGKGIADQFMRELGFRTASKCSKYCLGVNLVGAVSKNNNFRVTLARIKSSLEPVCQRDDLLPNTIDQKEG